MAASVELLRSSSRGAGRGDAVVTRPSWSAVEQAVRRLNGADYDDLYLERPDEATWLAIGGGDGRYFVMLTTAAHTDFESWLVVCREGAAAETESLVVGGQPGEYPARQVVGIDEAVEAARRYFATGEPSPSLTWERT